MPVFALQNNSLWFPSVDNAEEDGLLAMGGEVTTERIEAAYKKGIFPWYSFDMPLWWCPDPRFVLYPQELKISKSMKQVLKKDTFHCKINEQFEEIIHYCKITYREGQDGTWINDQIEKAYTALFYDNKAICAGTYTGDGRLVGGLYGVKLGNIFFGESMFSLEPNASKYSFVKLVDWLIKEGVVLIDCQLHTPHLESLGARFIDRSSFLEILYENIE